MIPISLFRPLFPAFKHQAIQVCNGSFHTCINPLTKTSRNYSFSTDRFKIGGKDYDRHSLMMGSIFNEINLNSYKELHDDESIVLHCMEKECNRLNGNVDNVVFSNRLRNDPEFMKKANEYKRENLLSRAKYGHLSVKEYPLYHDDAEFMLTAMKSDPYCWVYASSRLKLDPKFLEKVKEISLNRPRY